MNGMKNNFTRRDFLKVGGGLSLAAMLAGCGSFGVGQQKSGDGDGGGNVTVWDIATGEQQNFLKKTVKKYNSGGKDSVSLQFFQNDPYKNKLRVAMGSGSPPDLFYGWGGGVLKSYVDADKAEALDPGKVKADRFLDSVMGGATFDGKLYGIPNNGTQPVLFYYNKQIFSKYDLSPPETYSELLDAVRLLKGKGITPITLAGQNKWPYLMYAAYLVNRIGGNEPFQNVLAGESGAWSDSSFTEAWSRIQELVSLGAFPSGFTSLNFDTGQSTQLLTSDQAAMQLMGSWDYQNILSDSPEFIEQDKLGWFPFPAVEDGEGDPGNVTGNYTNYYSLTSASDAKDQALSFLADGVMNDDWIDGLISLGLVPPAKGIESKLREQETSDWLLFVYGLVSDAPYFDLSWDQALPPQPAQDVLTNLDQLFLGQINPKKFSQNMNASMDL